MPIDENSIDNAEEENVEKPNTVATPSFATLEEILSDLGIMVDKNQMSVEDHTKLTTFLAKNRDMLAKSLYDLPGTDVVQHKIDTGDQIPPRERLYRTTPAAKREIKAQLREMWKHDIIEESKADYGANVVLIKKKDGSHWFAVDYRKLNLIVKDTVFPLLSLEEVVDSLAEATSRVFFFLDLRNGYQQIKLTPESRENHPNHTPRVVQIYPFTIWGCK